MGITPKFTAQDFKQALLAKKKRLDMAIERRFRYLGEMCVNEARTNRGYTDRTGNLVNSVGYIVLRDGVVLRKNFTSTANPTAKAGTYQKNGQRAGESFAMEIAKDYARGWVLIVVAGMNYASYVEAKGKNVLSTAHKLAKAELPRMMADLKRNAA